LGKLLFNFTNGNKRLNNQGSITSWQNERGVRIFLSLADS